MTVTGATGHIGNTLVRELVARGERVRALALPLEDTTPLRGLDVDLVKGNVLDEASLIEAFEGSDLVYHLAGIVSIVPGKSDILYRVNVIGTRNVIRACLKTGVGRLVYTSSIHAIAEPPLGTSIDETLPFDPGKLAWEYDRSKAQATLEVLGAVARGLDAVVVCPTGVIGPYDFRPSEMGQLIIDFATASVKAYIDGAYDFVDVRDVATGHVLAGRKGRTGQSYILSGERITVRELLEVLEQLTGVPSPRTKLPVWLARSLAPLVLAYSRMTGRRPLMTSYSVHTLQRNCDASQDKARRELGYSSRPIRQSIADAVQWFRDSGRL